MDHQSTTSATPETWEQTLEILKGVIGADEYNSWLAPIGFEGFDAQARSVRISVSSDFYARWISRKYLDAIREAWQNASGNADDVAIDIVVNAASVTTVSDDAITEELEAENNGLLRAREEIAPTRTPSWAGSAAARPVIARPRLQQRYTFDDFVVGESNRYAHAAAQAVADPASQAFNPLFIYGPSGLGKTHLMQAIGHSFMARYPEATVVYVTIEQFINGFIESIQSKRPQEFRNQYRNVDLLLLDDVQFLIGKERTQQEIFHTFNALYDAGKKIVLTSDRPPKDLTTLEERLRQRFDWGVVADIAPPDLETRIAILRHKCRQEGIKVPPDVLQYIAEWVRSNIRELEGALKRIRMYANLHNAPITMDVAREMLSHLIGGQPQSRVTVEDIQRIVCEYFEITTQQLLGRNRSKRFSQPRHMALYLCRELTDLSFPDIAQKFGGKDHTSVIYAYRKISAAVSSDPSMANIVSYLTKQIQKGQPQG